MTWTSWYPAENAAKNKRLSGDSGSESLLLPLLCLIHKPFGAIIKWNSVTDEPQSSRHLWKSFCIITDLFWVSAFPGCMWASQIQRSVVTALYISRACVLLCFNWYLLFFYCWLTEIKLSLADTWHLEHWTLNIELDELFFCLFVCLFCSVLKSYCVCLVLETFLSAFDRGKPRHSGSQHSCYHFPLSLAGLWPADVPHVSLSSVILRSQR